MPPPIVSAMGIELNNPGLEQLRSLVRDGKVVTTENDWSDAAPTADEENAFIEKEGWTAYGHWHLGVDKSENRETKGAWSFPVGDFRTVHRAGVIAAESRAAQNDYDDIRDAAKKLLELIDGE